MPPEVFTTEWKNPVNATPEDARKHLAMAAKLLAEAGCQPKGGVLTNAAGRAAHGRVPARAARLRAHRAAVHRGRWRSSASRPACAPSTPRNTSAGAIPSISTSSYRPSRSRCRPATSSATIWGSEAAGKDGSRNVIGIKNPAIDKLIDKIILAKDRDDLVAATRALDRVLLWNHYVVPQWHTPFERMAMWDMYRPPGQAAVAQSVVPARVVVGRRGSQAACRARG